MECASQLPKLITVALPVYGTRVLPRFGIAREFLLAEVDRLAPGVRSTERRSWDPRAAPSLPAWLGGLGVSGVICGGIHPRFRIDLEAADLWVLSGRQGDAEDIVRQWATGRAPRPDGVPCSGVPRGDACTKRDRA